jgi:hypothetical protein
MTTTLNDAARASQEQILGTVRQSQQAVVDAVAAWAKAVENMIPPAPAIPGAGDLPKPDAVVDNAFDFAAKLLDAQREFAHSIIAAASPVLEKTETADTKTTAETKK